MRSLIQSRKRRQADGEEGFTLVELLVVVVILGILATIVVFAVTGFTGKSQTAACATDAKIVESAEGAANANGTVGYVTMSALVSDGYLHSSSQLWSVSVTTDTTGSGTAYSLTGIGSCAGQTPP